MHVVWTWPLSVRLAAVFAVGAAAGSLINWAVNRLATQPRPIGPWEQRHPEAPRRRAADFVPIAGWLGLARETVIHGERYWLRPLLVELFSAVGLALLYWWEVDRQGLLFAHAAPPGFATMPGMLHAQFIVHSVLIWLMATASLIDADEQIIPDSITIPGTLLGLVVAASYPPALLPIRQNPPHLLLTSPGNWPAWLNGPWGLAVGLGCFALWCVALLPRTWYTRHGLRRALQLCLARLARSAVTWLIAALAAAGMLTILMAWSHGAEPWQALLSTLVGLAAGGGIVWMVRVIGGAILRREAMGFGDVTLMCMIGAFLGWQAALIVFFLAPLAGIVVGLIGLIFRRQAEIAYGPFLCLAALALLLGWPRVWEGSPPLWNGARQIFALGLFVPAALLVCMVMLAVLLGIWQFIKTKLLGW